MLKLVNLTGEEVRISVYKPNFEAENAKLVKDGPTDIMIIPAAGKADLVGYDPEARVPASYADDGMANYPAQAGCGTKWGFTLYTSICDLRGFEDLYNEKNVVGVPEPQEDTIYIVPNYVAKALRGREDVIGQYTGNNIFNACWNSKTGEVNYRHYFTWYHDYDEHWRFWFEH